MAKKKTSFASIMRQVAKQTKKTAFKKSVQRAANKKKESSNRNDVAQAAQAAARAAQEATRSDHFCTGKGTQTADHMNCGRSCKIMEPDLA